MNPTASGTDGDPYIIEGWCITPPMSREGIGLDQPERAGIMIEKTNSRVVIRDNVIESRLLDDDIPLVSERQTKGIRLKNADQVTVENNEIRGHIYNLHATWSSGLTIEDNTVRHAYITGIQIHEGGFVTLAENTIERNGDGVLLDSVDRVTVEHYTLSRNRGGPGLKEGYSDQITVEANEITKNSLGVDVEDSSQVTVTDNNIHDNDPGLRVLGGVDPVDATNNWWGASDGPSRLVEDACTSIFADGSGERVHTTGLVGDHGAICFDPSLEAPVSHAGPGG